MLVLPRRSRRRRTCQGLRDEDTYRNGETAAVFLTGRTPADLRPIRRFWDQISYPAWIGLADALGS